VYGCRFATEGFDDICLINKDASGFARLTSDGRYNGQPAWSRDGTQIAFARTDFQLQRGDNPQMYIALMNADGTGVKRVATGASPAWSRDGGTIVFRNGTQPGLATVKPDGTGLTRITVDASDDAPAWRP
jgi:Tol biopolymer transport system component